MADYNNGNNGFFGGIFSDNSVYSSDLNIGPSAGVEKNYDSLDEKVTEDEIIEIPKYEVVARYKTAKVYYTYLDGFNVRKKACLKEMKKLAKIEAKLQRYANYPDDSFGRDKLVNERINTLNEINKHKKRIDEVIKPKLRIYGKALGKKRLSDEFFDFKVSESMLGLLLQKGDAFEERAVKEEKINQEVNKAKKSQSTVTDYKGKDLQEIYDKFVSKYGEEMVNKYWSSILEQIVLNEVSGSKNDLDDMLNDIENTNTNNRSL